MKKCSKCQNTKSLDAFMNKASTKDGKETMCKECYNTRAREYRKRTDEARKKTRKQHYQKNIEKMRAEKREYCKNHREDKQIYDITYRENNKDKIRNYKKEWSNKQKDNIIYRLKKNLRRRVHHAIRNNYKSDFTFNLIGCSPDEFKRYIESLWMPNMSWENYGIEGWHIDHIIPCFKFDLSKEDEQRKCFHYTNQRPLWATDNLSRPRATVDY